MGFCLFCFLVYLKISLPKVDSMEPKFPKLYSLIELHKIGFPIRPVVSFFSALSYNISYIITQYTDFSTKFQIKNSIELIKKIEFIKLPNNAKVISFDVTNLFPSIPVQDTITLVEKLLTSKNTDIIIKQDILEVLKICLDQNYFEFNGTFYSS